MIIEAKRLRYVTAALIAILLGMLAVFESSTIQAESHTGVTDSGLSNRLARTELQTSPPADNRSHIVTIRPVRTIDEIVAHAKLYPHRGFDGSKVTSYAVKPTFSAPYEAGELLQSDVEDALNALKMVRFLAGVPYDEVAFTKELNRISQHGALLMAATGQISHNLSQPNDMTDAFYSLAKRGGSEANVSAGRSNISNAVLGYIADGGANNIERVGHRRWVLKPCGQNFGIGFAQFGEDRFGGNRISMHVYEGPNAKDCEVDTYLAWPSAGDFPIQYFVHDESTHASPVYPWSINLGAAYEVPAREEVKLTLTRSRDGKQWQFDTRTPQLTLGNIPDDALHLAVDNQRIGQRKGIVFRPDLTSLGTIQEGDVFKIVLSGIRTAEGQPTTLSYSTRFFDLTEAMKDNNENLAYKQDGKR